MWNKSAEELRAALAAPFTSSDIEWRVSVTSQSKNSGLAVAYVTNRAIQNRLDDTVGVDGWYNEFILKQELHDLDEQFTSLRYLSDELQIRARGLRAQKRAA